MRSLAEFCYRRRRFVVVGWILLLIGLFGLSSAIGGEYRTEFELPDSASAQAIDLLEARGVTERTGFPGQIVFRADQGVQDPAVRQTMEGFFTQVTDALEGDQLQSPYDPQFAYQISQDGTIAYAELNLSDRENERYLEDGKEVRALWQQLDLPVGLQVELGSDLFAEEAEFSSELIGIGAAVIILLVAFGSVLAMGLPIITALVGIGCGFAIIGIVTRYLAVP